MWLIPSPNRPPCPCRLIPAHLLERMGLLEQPPHCQVSVSATEGERLLHITMDDVRRIQLPWGAASLLAPAGAAQPPAAAGAGDAGSGGSSREGSTAQQPGAAAEQAAAGGGGCGGSKGRWRGLAAARECQAPR